MRWENKDTRRARWHRWFAWKPVEIGKQVVWLEWVERIIYFDDDGYEHCEYRNAP